MYKVHKDEQNKDAVTIAVVHVDDGILVSTDDNENDRVITRLKKTVKIRKHTHLNKIGDSVIFLGGDITYTPGGYHLSSIKNANKFVDSLDLKRSLETTKKVPTPLQPGVKLSDPAQNKLSKPLDEQKHAHYRSAVGSLGYLTNLCMPILAYPRSQLSASLNEPKIRHWNSLRRVGIFVGQNKDLGILYQFGIDKEFPGVLDNTDSSFRDHIPTQRSTGSTCDFYNRGIVAWNSKRQETVASSTAHAEIIAADKGIKNGLQITHLLKEILPKEWVLKDGIQIHQNDNKAAWKHINKMKTFEATKHLPVSYFYVRELIEDKVLESNWIPGSENVADLGTKAVSAPVLKLLLPKMMVSLKEAMNMTSES